MAKHPYMPLWTDAYLADTRHLTRDEHGAYLLLLMEAWRRPSCSLPDDDALLARLTLSTADEWQRLKPVVMAFWKLDKRRREFVQKRLTSERVFVANQSAMQRDKAAKRWSKTKNADAAAMPDECRGNAPTPTPTPTPLEKKETETERARERDFPPPADPQPEPPRVVSIRPDVSFIERMIHAAGHTSGTIPAYWMPPASEMAIRRDFIGALGLTEDECVQVTAATRQRIGEPIRGPKGLISAMRMFAEAKNGPALQPNAPRPSQQAPPPPKTDVLAKLRDDLAAKRMKFDGSS